MHELSIIYNVLEIAKEHATNNAISRINKIVLSIGEFCALQEDSLNFAFKNLSKDSLCEEALLVIEKKDAQAYCKNCNRIFKIDLKHKVCPICKQFSHDITTGYEILVASIEGDSDETI